MIMKADRIFIRPSLCELDDLLCNYESVFVIMDSNLKPYINEFDRFNPIYIHTSESSKTLETVEEITGQLLERDAHRGSFIVGIGGGITTDIAGFVASTYKRGVKFGFIPTTLLAQADASIGGKNGVNFHSYKNIIGTITQPEWIYICPHLLGTLSCREFRAGIAEVMKTFLLFDREYYKATLEYFSKLMHIYETHNTYTPDGNFYNLPLLIDIIGKCAQYKNGVVERDEFERGERRLLNLGHTFAHAIEKIYGEYANSNENRANAANEGIMHGEAVSIGLVLAAKLSGRMGMASNGFVQKLGNDLKSVGLPIQIPCNPVTGERISMAQIVDALKKDKKVSGEHINLILPQEIGCVKDMNISIKELEELAGDLC